MPLGMGGIQAILALAAGLRGFFGGGGGDDDMSAEERAVMKAFMDRLRVLMEGQIGFENIRGMRGSLLSDPELLSSIDSRTLAQLGIKTPEEASKLVAGAVPLQRAVMNLAFGLLPRFARTTQGPGPFAGTPEQQALLGQSLGSRFGPRGFGFEMPAGTTDPLWEMIMPSDDRPPNGGGSTNGGGSSNGAEG